MGVEEPGEWRATGRGIPVLGKGQEGSWVGDSYSRIQTLEEQRSTRHNSNFPACLGQLIQTWNQGMISGRQMCATAHQQGPSGCWEGGVAQLQSCWNLLVFWMNIYRLSEKILPIIWVSMEVCRGRCGPSRPASKPFTIHPLLYRANSSDYIQMGTWCGCAIPAASSPHCGNVLCLCSAAGTGDWLCCIVT